MTYPNGRVPANAIVHIDGAPFEVGLGNAYLAAQAAAKNDGVSVRIINKYSAYRDWNLQGDMNRNPRAYGVQPGVHPSVAGASLHGGGNEGFAVDVIEGRQWMIENGKRFGFSHLFPITDPNHFTHDGVTAIHGIATAGVGTTTVVTPPTTKVDNDMKLAVIALAAGGYEGRLVFSDGTFSAPLGDAALASLRENKPKGQGPLGDEFSWSAQEWARLKGVVWTGGQRAAAK